jgi:molybdate transport system substrate-binding protein
MRTTFLAAARVGTTILLSHGFAAKAAEVKIIAGGPLTAVFKELGPQFERDTGHKLVTRFAVTSVVKREIDAGDTFDLAISSTSGIDDWIKEGKIVAATRAVVAYAGLGVGVRAGAPKPDIGSVEASRRALLNAKSVAHGAESASAASFKGLLERLGIAEEMKPKLKPVVGGAVVKSVTSGEVEIVVAVVPGIVAAPGVELVGPFPSELQTYISFTAGVSTGAKEPEAAQALIKFLTSPAAFAVIKAKGMHPGAPQ